MMSTPELIVDQLQSYVLLNEISPTSLTTTGYALAAFARIFERQGTPTISTYSPFL